MSRYKKSVLDRLGELERMVDQVSRSIEKIEVATIVREPRSQVAVDAYDGLRRQIVAAAGERMAHLHQLVLFAEAVTVPGPAVNLTPVVLEWMQQAGVERVEDVRDPDYYEVLGGTGPELRVLRPAYRDQVTGRPIRMGQTERVVAGSPRHLPSGELNQDGHREAAR
jgi:hypothetical protein